MLRRRPVPGRQVPRSRKYGDVVAEWPLATHPKTKETVNESIDPFCRARRRRLPGGLRVLPDARGRPRARALVAAGPLARPVVVDAAPDRADPHRAPCER